MGYSPWGCKESNVTEKLTLSLSKEKLKITMKEDWIMGGWDHCDKIWGLIEIRHVNYVHGKCFICDGLLRWLSTRDTSDDDGGEHEEKKSLKSVGPSLHFP